MPLYQNQQCEGACERLGHACQAPGLFADTAAQYGAVPAPETRRDEHGDWVVMKLGFPGETQARALHALTRHFVRENPIGAPTQAAQQAAQEAAFWMNELPCHLECSLTLCGYCGDVHEATAIRDGWCDYQDLDDEEPEPDDNEDDEHDENLADLDNL